jgi:hypothetical protein
MGSRMSLRAPLQSALVTSLLHFLGTCITVHNCCEPQQNDSFLLDALLLLPETFLHTHLISRVQFAL